MRYFVSLPVPDGAREDLDDFLEPRRIAERALRWSAPERWHLTLAFLPDVDDVDLDDLSERLENACARRRPVTLALRGRDVFGGALAARVLWADVAASAEDREELERLAVGARHAALSAGTVVEGGRFVPHVTLARSPRPRDLRRLVDVLELYAGPPWRADSVDLVASHVRDRPVRHEVVGSFSLGSPDQGEKDAWWRRGYGGR